MEVPIYFEGHRDFFFGFECTQLAHQLHQERTLMEVPIYFEGHRGLQARVALQYIEFFVRVEFLLKTDSGYPKDTGVNVCLVENPRAYSHRFFSSSFLAIVFWHSRISPLDFSPRRWISQNKRMASFATSLSRPRYSAHRVRVHDSVRQGQQ